MMPDFDQLTQYVIEIDGVPTVMPLNVTDTPMPEAESTAEPFTPYIPPPTLDERVVTLEESIEVLFGGAE